MVWRSLVSRTRSSREASSGAAGRARRPGAGAGAGPGGDRAGDGLRWLEHVAFSTCPRLPLPATPLRSTPFSTAIFAADARRHGRRRRWAGAWRRRGASLLRERKRGRSGAE